MDVIATAPSHKAIMNQFLPVAPYSGQRIYLPQASTARNLQETAGLQSGPSSSSPPGLDDDSMSTCSDRCSQKTCSDCCEGDECNEACMKSCHGFVDCDDLEACTNPNCAEADCRDIAPPCFDRNCLRRLPDQIMAEPEHVVTTSSQSQSERQCIPPDQPVYHDFLGNSGIDVQEADESLQKHDLPYPSANTVNRSGTSPPSMIPSMSSSNDGTPMDVDSSGTILHCLWGTGCDEEFCDWSALDEHIYRTHIKPQNKVKCRWDNCDQAADPNEIIDHVKADHSSSSSDEEGQEQTCHWSECSLTLPPGPSGLERHVRSTHVPVEKNLVECQWDSCGFLTEDPDALSMHLQTDHFLDPLSQSHRSVDVSGNAPGTSTSIQGTGVKLQICRWMMAADNDISGEARILCNSQFLDAASLQQHIKEEHLTSLTKKMGYICQWEGCLRRGIQPFSQKGKLERHVQIHTGFKASRCDTCGKEFSGPVALQQHERTHTGEKPYACETCGKRFAQSTALIMHIRTHTKEKPLKCDYPGCNKTFSESSTLSKHKKTHNDYGSYRCTHPDCSSTFRRFDQLKRHHALVHGPSRSFLGT